MTYCLYRIIYRCFSSSYRQLLLPLSQRRSLHYQTACPMVKAAASASVRGGLCVLAPTTAEFVDAPRVTSVRQQGSTWITTGCAMTACYRTRQGKWPLRPIPNRSVVCPPLDCHKLGAVLDVTPTIYVLTLNVCLLLTETGGTL